MCRDRGWRAGLCHRRLACLARRRGVKSGWRVVAQAGLHCTRRSLCCVTAPRGDTATLLYFEVFSHYTFIFFAKTTFCQKQAHSHKRQSTNPIIRVRSFRSFTAGACRAHSGQRSPLYYVLPTEPSPSSAALGEHWQAVVRANVGAARQPLVDARGVEDVAACVSKEASKA